MQLQETKTPRRAKVLRFGTVALVAAAGVLTVASPSWAIDTATVSPVSGPSGGGNTVTLNVASPTASLAFVQGSASVVFSALATCPATYPSPPANTFVLAANVRVISASKLAVTVPTGVTTSFGATPGTTSVCAYASDTAGSAELAGANAGYAVLAAATITSVTPAAAATQGGGTVTITGTNLTGGVATIGGAPLGSPVVTATQITGTIPAHVAGGPFPVIVSITGGGTVTKAGAFTYSSGLVVSPNTAPNTKTRTDIDVVGSGFTSWTFTTTNGTTPNDTNSHVYLVKGAYDPTKSGSAKTNGQTTECMNVLVVSDTELVCSLYLAGGGIPQTATHPVTGTVAGSVFTATIGTFTNGDLGTVVSGSGSIAANTTIMSITDSTHAMLSKAATAAITTATALTLNSSTRTNTDSTLTVGSTTLGSSGAAFVTTDVGRTVTGTGIPAGTTIASVTNGTTAVLSQAATVATTANGSFTISYAPTATPVPNGTYTVTAVSDGGVDVQFGGASADASYVRSVINSGSTFTVADF